MPHTRPIANRNQPPAANDPVSEQSRGDQVQPFLLEVSQLRGRMVRLGDAVDTILRHHAYPLPVATLLAEALCLTALLAGMLKFDGIFTFQAKGNGPVKLIVCDLTTKGHLRGTATFDAEAITALSHKRDAGQPYTLQELCGGGYLAFTVDQKNAADRYQGIVELTGERLSDAVRHYFHQSEQIKTGIEIAIGQPYAGEGGAADTSGWQAAAIMLQQLATTGGVQFDQADGSLMLGEMLEPPSEVTLDHWRRAMLLLGTASAAEMLDGNLPVNDVLYRLFHEEGVRVFPPLPIIAKCRCSRKKIAPIIDPLPYKEKQKLAENGRITVTCEFCNRHYRFKVAPPETM